MSVARIPQEAREDAATWCARIAEGPLDEEGRRAFQTWLDAAAEHPALFERTVAAWQAIEDQAGAPELIRMRGGALESLRRANGRRWMRVGTLWRAAAIAASLLIALGLGISWYLAPARYVTGIGERRVVALADGSSISLDAASEVDVRYSGDRRQLWLRRGRAKFSVAHDPLRPFSVAAGKRMVIATGTQFSVETLPDQVRVVLYEGHVSVLDTEGATSRPVAVRVGARQVSAEQALAPGRELILAAARPQGRIAPVDAGPSLAWESGLMQFDEEPLGIAVERMNRYAATKLRAGDAAAAAMPISGQFVGGDVGAFVEGVTAVFPLTASRRGGEIVFRARGAARDTNS